MMDLNRDQRRRADAIFRFLKPKSPSFFKDSPIYKCTTCKGTGLDAVYHDGSYSWNTHSYCDDCKGVGFKGLSSSMQIDDIHYICHLCNGTGCHKCNEGIVDWVSHAMG